jgi:hypothetical protein
MMSLEERKRLYETATVDGNRELDYLKTSITSMNLKTVDKYRITSATANRPDLIANIYYGNYNLGWLLHAHNNILDPLTEYSVGRVIDIPSIDDYYRHYNRNARRE